MSYLISELYQEIIIDHNRYPRNHHALESPNAIAHGHNPLCGDKLTVYLNIKNNQVEKISFLGSGCAISQASASLMTEALMGKTLEQAESLIHLFHDMLTCENENTLSQMNTCQEIQVNLQKLSALEGVKAFPARVKCATLAWHTLSAALRNDQNLISTETFDARV